MQKHKIYILWDAYVAKEAKEIFEIGVKHMSDGSLEGVEFDVEYKKSPFGSFGLESGVLVAIIASSTALITSIVSLVAQIIASKITSSQAIMEIQLNDGTMVKIPTSAHKEEMEKRLSMVKSLRNIGEIRIVTD